MFNLNGIVEPYSFWVVYHETELPRSVDSYAIVESFLLEMHYYKSWSTQPAVRKSVGLTCVSRWTRTVQPSSNS
jgi:hypothetical protein